MGGLRFILVWIILTLFLPYQVFNYFDDIDLTLELVVSLGILLYTAARLSWLAAAGRPQLLTITFFAFVYVWIGLAASAQIIAGDFPWDPRHDDEDVLPALVMIALAMASFEAGHAWFRLRPPASVRTGGAPGFSLVLPDRAVVGLCAVAMVLTLIGMWRVGFGNLFVTHAAMSGVLGRAGGGSKTASLVWSALLRTPSLIASTVILYNASRRWSTFDRPRKRFYALSGMLMVLLDFVANYPPAQTRFWLGAVVLTPAFALPRWRRWFAPMWILGFAAGLTVVFPYLDLFRHAASVEQAFEKLNVNQDITDKILHKGDYDVFQMTVDTYHVSNQIGATMGRNLTGAVFFFVPRKLWPDKAYGTGQTVGKTLHRSFTNLSAPLWTEFFYAFGWIGVVGLMLLYARACAWGEHLYERSLQPGAPDSLARLLVPYWAAFHMFMLRGDLQNSIAFSAFGYAMLLGTAVLPRIWGRSREAQPALLLRPDRPRGSR